MTSIPIVVYYVLVLHWLADFVSQSNYVAINKSRDIMVLLWHVTTYIFILGLGLLVVGYGNIQFLLLNAAAHLTTDFFTSKANSYLWRTERRRGFFTMIGFDQLLHTVVLLKTAEGFLL